MDTPTTRGGDPDELAIQRFRYLLRTAPPDAVEAAHREAFEQLTPEQRRRVLEGLATQVDPSELHGADASPDALARLATRAEIRRPGSMERAFATGRGTTGGSGDSFLGMLAGAFVGTTIASALFAGDSADVDDAGAADSVAEESGDGGVSGGDEGRGVGGDRDGGAGDGGGDPGFDTGDGGFDGGGFDLGF